MGRWTPAERTDDHDIKRWQEWVNVLLGVWLFVSPWAMSYTTDVQPAAWNAYILGTAIVVVSVVAVYLPKVWLEGVGILLGIWTIISPWMIGYHTHSAVALNAVAVGLLVAGLATWAIVRDGGFEKWWGRHQTT